jgi:biopolymer transport protein ExbD
VNFHVRRRRSPVLQIINMIDILIILLIFLVVSTSFKESHSVLNVSVPVSDALALGTDSERRTGISLTKEGKVYLDDREVPAAETATALASLRSARPDARLDLRIDENVPFGTIIKVWDALTKAGYKVGDVPARVLRAKAAASP